MIISEIVKQFEKHQEEKMHKISMAAFIARANISLALKSTIEEERAKHLENVLKDLDLIENVLTKNDFEVKK